MTHEQDQYFEYLMRRSRLGHAYRRHVLYPRLVKRLRGRMLDVGCGIGDMLAFRPDSVGVDINERTVAYCRAHGLEAHVMQPDRLPFDAGSFDSVLLDNVLEHIAQPTPLLAEVHRVLKAGGRLLVGVPGVRGWHSDPDHKVMYDQASLVDRVCEAGFEGAEVFHTPLFRSAWLSGKVRQYCIYGAFDRA
jgi:SAM-dependent methyltransferase